MEEKKPVSHIVAGLLISLAVIVFSVVMTFVAGGGADPRGGWISYLIIIIGLVIFIQRYGKAKNNQVTFGELFSYGFKATTMIILLFVIFLLILSYIKPEIKQGVLEATRMEFEKQKNITDKEIDTMMEMTNKYFWIVLIGTSMFFFALIGAIGSLIGAAITKKQPKDPFEQTTF
jgi:hypothetical protein